MKKITFSIIISVLLLLVLFITFNKPPFKIGFSGSLSGKNAPLGIAVKDGIVLALEEINAKGGVKGKKLELIIKDDQNDPKTAIRVDNELIEEGVCVIIGHVTSAMTEAALGLANAKKMLLLSPTTSSLTLLEKDDNLISIHPSNIYEQETLAEYTIHRCSKISIIYDNENQAFSEPWVSYFSDYFESRGGSIEEISHFSSKENDLFTTIGNVLTKETQALLIVASAIDTTRICQLVERQYPQQVLKLSTGWGLDNALFEQGGKSINGLIIASSWDKDSTTTDYLHFKEAFLKRYNREPQFAETYGYETIMLLDEVLKSGVNPKPMKIKQNFLDIGQFKGLQGTISIDDQGKTKRDVFLFTVKENTLKRILDE